MRLPFPMLLAPDFLELSERWAAIPDEFESNARAMMQLTQRVRELGAVPVRVTSWYRSPVRNVIAGGAAGSQHLTASAVDLVPSSDVREWFDRVRLALPRSDYGQLIYERSHVHLSLPNRASGRTGEVLTEPTEGQYLPVPGSRPPDDSREGIANPNTVGLVVLFLIFFVLADR